MLLAAFPEFAETRAKGSIALRVERWFSARRKLDENVVRIRKDVVL
jgi:hypothetical protein